MNAEYLYSLGSMPLILDIWAVAMDTFILSFLLIRLYTLPSYNNKICVGSCHLAIDAKTTSLDKTLA